MKLLQITDPVELEAYLQSMEKDSKDLSSVIYEIMWHFRGSISRDEAWTLSPKERHEMMMLINERIKLVEKTKLPLL
jgi:hypothetical protein